MRKITRFPASLLIALLCLSPGMSQLAFAQRAAPRPLNNRKQQARSRGPIRAAAGRRQGNSAAANLPDPQVKGVPQPAVSSTQVTVSALPQVSAADLAAREVRAVPEPEGEEEIPQDRPVPPGATVFKDATGLAQTQGLPEGPLVPSPATTASFSGSFGTGWIPPDTQGAVGPNHLVVAVNGGLQVQNKSGNTLASVSLDGFFAPVMNGSTDVFDPRVEYDQFSGRWILIAVADRDSAASAVLAAATQTGDPTGVWNLYRLDADASNTSWADFPILGFNKDWIVVSTNMFAVTGSGAGFFSRFFVINKATAYAGTGLSLSIISAPGSISGSMTPTATLDNTLATMYVLQNWNGNSGGSGFLRLYTITGAVNAPVLNNTSTGVFIGAAAPWDSIPPSGNDFAPQLGSGVKIQTNDSRMGKVVYRNGSLWAAHTVFLPAGGTPTRSAVQWWEINPQTQALVQRGRVDDAAGATFYAFPSIAVNKDKDVLVGYSRFSATQYAAAAYSFRAGTDAASTLRDPMTLKAGEGVYSQLVNGRNRWGDYSGAAVDPANDTDLWTIQEYATAFNDWGTWWGRVGGGGGDTTCTATPISVGQTINATLSAASCRYPGGSSKYADQYTFTGTAGQKIAVSLSSSSFDTFLALVGPSGTELTSDDDGGGGTNSRIPAGSGFYTLPASGTYTIQAAALLDNTGGAYTLSLTAPGGSCTYAINPTSNSFGAGVGTGSVSVTTQAGCSWSATSNAAWLTISSGAAGTGSGVVNYSVAANISSSTRTGTLTIAGQTFTVTQSGAGAAVGLRFYPLPAPVRLLDTRAGEAACNTPGSPIQSGVVRTQVAVGTCTGVPAGAQAIVGNVAVVNTVSGAGSGFVTLFPSNVPQPLAANINYTPGQIVNNFFTVGLGADGAFNIYAFTTLHLVIDVTGYYAP